MQQMKKGARHPGYTNARPVCGQDGLYLEVRFSPAGISANTHQAKAVAGNTIKFSADFFLDKRLWGVCWSPSSPTKHCPLKEFLWGPWATPGGSTYRLNLRRIQGFVPVGLGVGTGMLLLSRMQGCTWAHLRRLQL